jgi:hypothetical protein
VVAGGNSNSDDYIITARRIHDRALNYSLNLYHYDAHHGRALHRKMQKANLGRLMNASSNSAAFWKMYRSMADPKPRSPAVSLADLAECFEKRMNAQDPAPNLG